MVNIQLATKVLKENLSYNSKYPSSCIHSPLLIAPPFQRQTATQNAATDLFTISYNRNTFHNTQDNDYLIYLICIFPKDNLIYNSVMLLILNLNENLLKSFKIFLILRIQGKSNNKTN